MGPQHYQYFPRSVSWQVASLLNPSLNSHAPGSTHQAKHGSVPRPVATAPFGPRCETAPDANYAIPSYPPETVKPASQESGPPPSPPTSAHKSWHEETVSGRKKLALPPQYVSPSELCKAMPRYMRIKVRPESINGKPVPFSTAISEVPLHAHSACLSPQYDIAPGSPISDTSGKLTPRSVLDFPQQNIPQSTKSAHFITCSPSPARSPHNTPPLAISSSEPTPFVCVRHQNTPEERSAQHSDENPQSPRPRSAGSDSGRQLVPQLPRSRSIATSPTRPVVNTPAADVSLRTAAAIESKLKIVVNSPQLKRVVRTDDKPKGSPLSPANPETLTRLSTPPVALPPTPPSRVTRRFRHPHPLEPTLDTYKKFSPNIHATNTVWNERRDVKDNSRPRTIRIKSADGTKSMTSTK